MTGENELTADQIASLRAEHGNEAIDRELARIASGAKAAEQQDATDEAYAPSSVNEYRLDLPNGREWDAEARPEVLELKTELHAAGVNPGIASALFNQVPAFLQMDEDSHFSSVESAVNVFKQANGEAAFQDVQRFVRSLKSENLKVGALVAGMSQMGLKEMARLGRRLSR